jgi:hypothetical protein
MVVHRVEISSMYQLGGFYQAQVTLSAFEIQSEIITDLLRPSSKGLPVLITADEGVAVQGLHKVIFFVV